MGGHFWTHIAAWTFFYLMRVTSADIELLQDLGLQELPDVTKINISQDEYTHMMSIYLEGLQESSNGEVIPKLITFNSEQKVRRQKRDYVSRLKFPITPVHGEIGVEQATLRLLAPPIPGAKAVRIQVYQVLGARRRRFLEETLVYMSATASKWCEIDVTRGVQSWLNGDRNLGVELECPECNDLFRPLQASVSALVYPELRRVRRAIHNYEQEGRTDCQAGDTKQKCCRHTMTVTFKELKVPQISSIIQPKSYEAGFCKGRCPLNYNHATNHSRIQSLVHRMDRKAVPRVCCAPSKLAPLDILRVDPYDFTKLSVEKWDNMRVLECACS